MQNLHLQKNFCKSTPPNVPLIVWPLYLVADKKRYQTVLQGGEKATVNLPKESTKIK